MTKGVTTVKYDIDFKDTITAVIALEWAMKEKLEQREMFIGFRDRAIADNDPDHADRLDVLIEGYTDEIASLSRVIEELRRL